jgi:hypothetical protein
LGRLQTAILYGFGDLIEFTPRFSSDIQIQIPWKLLRFLERILSKIPQEILGMTSFLFSFQAKSLLSALATLMT